MTLALFELRLSRLPVGVLRDAPRRAPLREPGLEPLLLAGLFFLLSPAICYVLPVVPVGCDIIAARILHVQTFSGHSPDPAGV
jgi:hypothetical protein